jgi:hypothetical protein
MLKDDLSIKVLDYGNIKSKHLAFFISQQNSVELKNFTKDKVRLLHLKGENLFCVSYAVILKERFVSLENEAIFESKEDLYNFLNMKYGK